jgi:two-component system response regulator HydG
MNRPTDTLPVLLVDDEPSVLQGTKLLLAGAGIRPVLTLEESGELMGLLAEREVAVIVLDLFMPSRPGLELLPEIVAAHPEIPVIVMTAAQDVDTAVLSMKGGAFDYLVKPVEESRLVSAVKRALEIRSLKRQVNLLKKYLLSDQLENAQQFASFDSNSKKLHAIFQYAEAISSSSEPVLITGETGVGKEMLARAVHRLSGRQGELVPVNVAGLDDILFSDTLFGHRKGAFTGADSHREGLIEKAAGGTLFLDEIGDLAIPSQIKLLRLLQDQRYYPLGSDIAKNCEVRFICATNRNLQQRMLEGHFRSDLYYRLSVHQMELPPLRERREDLPLLVNRFVDDASRALGRSTPPLPPPELFDLLANYRFPGNIRELRALIHDAVAAHRGGAFLALERFRKAMQQQQADPLPKPAEPGEQALLQIPGRFPTLAQAETELVQQALRRANGNQGIAATLLGISRPALNRRLARMHGGPEGSETG